MKFKDLKVGQKIRFAASEYSLSYLGIVEERYSDCGQDKAVIKVANYKIIIDDSYLLFDEADVIKWNVKIEFVNMARSITS